ncbi:MAG: glutamate--tRNA ligase [Candidatus Buchananbacteria bacterium RIFCSPHIGHO2_02_FULL_40_13]|uniref:Glutamate--tRNA ligase n=1 Tax=Candidatus Buchananbacteria bacterium RIFCSPLOWO2_01_FULL_39_33 TaxID=1797543 RepID=A0A1G1YL71_9BACT|nr:MAG: glutamate--tRNA ligase [Candidatus Buchananbacteria bacterium RIFCSPHIGHO2_02_FULL_40_13]OGY53082.1 MAG: glutamate--tRNA ligase [Candidatus Buchananbacteria bacterium RIFCSPLOWO2_01_FULL_39_33]
MFFNKKQKIRTRFAPSPTGWLHIGGLRTALYEYIFARQNKGTFVLRLEDTDQTREVEGAIESLLKSLKWAGLEPDEGVFLDNNGKVAEKGNFGPYTQSKRVKIYQKYAQKLLAGSQAYYCFCPPERLEQLKTKQQAAGQPTHYDRACLKLTEDEIQAKLAIGERHVIRFKVPAGQEVKFNDAVKGEIKFSANDLDDQIILKSDGFPTYHLASVVDDYLMKINYVIRGEEWLSSTPKHILLYQAFSWPVPQFAHLPLLLNPDKSKLSKRQGDVAVEAYRDQGYLPKALINFVALLGWNPGTEQEIFSLQELIKVFNLKKVHKAGAIFNREKLDWFNGEYLKKLPLDDFKKMASPYLEKNISHISPNLNLDKLFEIEQQRISCLSEIGKELKFIFSDELNYSAQDLVWKKSDQKSTLKNLELLIAELVKYPKGEWSAPKLENHIRSFIAKTGQSNGDILWPMRLALTGELKSPTPFEVAEILGQAKSLKRLEVAIEKLK